MSLSRRVPQTGQVHSLIDNAFLPSYTERYFLCRLRFMLKKPISVLKLGQAI